MAKLLFRESKNPSEPTAVSSGSAAKGTPLTNTEGDWNFFALNQELALKASSASPVFVGATSFDQNLRTSGFDQFEYSLNGTIGTGGVLLGSIITENNDNCHFDFRVAGTSGTAGNFGVAFAQVAVRSGTLPATDGKIFANTVSVTGVSLKIEAWKATSDGKVYFYAVPSETLQSLFVTVKVSTRSNTHTFVPASTVTAKSTSGQTQFTGAVVVDFTGYEIKGAFTGDVTGTASSATKLQTPRVINGTSFDGTGNITTNSWGTARNITIGSKTNSVNGAGNVSWSLADIGAAAASHNHTLSNITQSGASVGFVPIWSGSAWVATAGDFVKMPASTSFTYTSGKVTKITEDGVATNITYNGDGTVNTISYPRGGKTRTETYAYSAGTLTGITATEV